MNDQLANPYRKPLSGEGSRRPPPPIRGTPKELVKLYVMALVFLLSIAGMVWMKKFTQPPPPKKNAPGEIDYTIRKDPAPEGQEKPDGALVEPPKKKDVALQDLPKEGAVDFKKLAEPFRDGLEKPVKETPEFVAVLRTMINSVAPETATRLVNPTLTANDAYLDPVKARGEVVRAYGQIVYLYTEPLDTTIPENRSHVYLGFMTEYRTNRTVSFYLADLPTDPKTGERIKFSTRRSTEHVFYTDWIEVEGVFLRRYDYESQNEQKGQPILARSALLFARNLRLAEPPKISNSRTGYVVGVSLIAAVIVVVVLVAGIMTRRYGAGSLKDKMKALKGGAAAPVFPKPDPAKQLLGAEVPTSSPPPSEPPGTPPPAAS